MNEKTKPELFCPRLFNSINVLPDGTVRMCCKVPYVIKNQYGWAMNLYENSYQEIWNSEYMQRLRKSMLDNKKNHECNFCYLAEAAGKKSDRMNMLLNPQLNDVNTDLVADIPTVIELDLGNLCNLKCRMCNPTSSSSVENDKIHSNWSPPYSRLPKPDKHWSTNKELIFGEIFAEPDKVIFLQFAGGEPMLSKTAFDVIEFLATNNYSKNITLNITTNATIFNKKLLDYLSTFLKIDFGVSVEGIGKVNDYIRYPSRWQDIEKNLDIMRTLKNANIYLATVIQAYNLIYIKEILEYADQNNLVIYFNYLTKPIFLQPNLLPEGILQETVDQLNSYVNTRHKNEIEYVLKIIKNTVISNKDELFKDFMLFTNDLDKSRGQSLKKTLPELYEKLIKYGVAWDSQTKYVPPTQIKYLA